jgi:hypothetical protein
MPHLPTFPLSAPQLIATDGHSYPASLQQQLADAVNLDDPLTADLAELDHAVGETFAESANALLTRLSQLRLLVKDNPLNRLEATPVGLHYRWGVRSSTSALS